LDGFTWNLLVAASGIAFTHTLLGPDHYLPFLMLARANRWSRKRTLVVTALCGLGHVASSVLLGGIGIAAGAAATRLGRIESARGDWAAWGLIAFGLAYGVWGIRHALRRKRGLEPHDHGGHAHLHRGGGHLHQHPGRDGADPSHPNVTFWTLFAIFVLGPCEPLIPLLILPASRGRWDLMWGTALLFGAITVATMLALTLAGARGLEWIPAARMERWSNAMAGAVIAASGLTVIGLGL
jgi:threonine/homoserine/homoserine lactone efflux protein